MPSANRFKFNGRYTELRKSPEDQMRDRFRIGAAWAITALLCGVLIAAAFWHF
jgi:hypothetical protein